jgi:hypothetical protein
MHFPRVTILTALLTLLAICTSCSGFWDIPISSIAVAPPSPSLLTGFQQQFTAAATYVDGSTGVLKGSVWTSSNAAIVFINANGIATAVATGSATISASLTGNLGSTTITATSGNISGSTTLTVTC